MTSMRRNDVASTSFRRHVPTRFLTNQCQIITFLILKYDIIENSRIELRGIVLPVQVGGFLGGPKGMLAPLTNYWGGLAPPPPPPPPFLRLCSKRQFRMNYPREISITPVIDQFYQCTCENIHPQDLVSLGSPYIAFACSEYVKLPLLLLYKLIPSVYKNKTFHKIMNKKKL